MKKRKEKKKEGKEKEDHRYGIRVWIHVLGCMEFEYSFVWKLWEYGSLVLV